MNSPVRKTNRKYSLCKKILLVLLFHPNFFSFLFFLKMTSCQHGLSLVTVAKTYIRTSSTQSESLCNLRSKFTKLSRKLH